MLQRGLGVERDLVRAEELFAKMRLLESAAVVPGALAQMGIQLQRVGDWLAQMLSEPWW